MSHHYWELSYCGEPTDFCEPDPGPVHYAVVAFRKARDLAEMAEHRSAWVPEAEGCFDATEAHELAAHLLRQPGYLVDVSPCHCDRPLGCGEGS